MAAFTLQFIKLSPFEISSLIFHQSTLVQKLSALLRCQFLFELESGVTGRRKVRRIPLLFLIGSVIQLVELVRSQRIVHAFLSHLVACMQPVKRMAATKSRPTRRYEYGLVPPKKPSTTTKKLQQASWPTATVFQPKK